MININKKLINFSSLASKLPQFFFSFSLKSKRKEEGKRKKEEEE